MHDIDRQTIFSGILRVLMQDRKLTHAALSKDLGATMTAIKNYTSGQAFPVVKTLCKLSDYFGVTPDQMLGYRKLTEEQLPPPEPPKVRSRTNSELAELFRNQLSENGKTFADYKEIMAELQSAIIKNTKI
jgi:transcriptional regulator with XRE-family HTH domain